MRRRVAPLHAANLLNSGSVRDAFELARRVRPTRRCSISPMRSRSSLWSAIAIESGLGWSELETWATAALTDGVRLEVRARPDSGPSRLACGLLPRPVHRGGSVAGRGRAPARAARRRRRARDNQLDAGRRRLFTGDHEAVGLALARCRAAVGDHAPANQLPYFARAEAWAVLAGGIHLAPSSCSSRPRDASRARSTRHVSPTRRCAPERRLGGWRVISRRSPSAVTPRSPPLTRSRQRPRRRRRRRPGRCRR